MHETRNALWAYRWEARLRLERGCIALDEGNLEEARDAIEQAVETSGKLDDPLVAVEARVALANLYLATPGPENAQRALEILYQAEQANPSHFSSEGGQGADADSEVDILTTRARALAAAGSTTDAVHALDSGATRVAGMLPPVGHTAALLVRIARTAIDIGAHGLAEDLATRALDMARAAGDVYAERHAAETLDRARPLTA